MKYSARTRRSMVKAFTKALAALPPTLCKDFDEEHRSPYICDAIRRTSRSATADVATDFISERIGHMFSVERWLKEQGEEIWHQVNLDVVCNNGRKLQAYRKAWLQSLITEFEA